MPRISQQLVQDQLKKSVAEFMMADYEDPKVDIHALARDVYFYTTVGNNIYNVNIKYHSNLCSCCITKQNQAKFKSTVNKFIREFDKIVGLNGSRIMVESRKHVLRVHRNLQDIFAGSADNEGNPLFSMDIIVSKKPKKDQVCVACGEPVDLENKNPTDCKHKGCIAIIKHDKRNVCLECGEIFEE